MIKEEIEKYIRNCPYRTKEYIDINIDGLFKGIHIAGCLLNSRENCPSENCVCAKNFYSNILKK